MSNNLSAFKNVNKMFVVPKGEKIANSPTTVLTYASLPLIILSIIAMFTQGFSIPLSPFLVIAIVSFPMAMSFFFFNG